MKLGYGILAGFVATIVLSLIMLLKVAAGMLPQFNAIRMLAMVGHKYVGLMALPVFGWVAHFLIGSVLWGILFAWIAGKLSGPYWVRGAVFSVFAWLLMMTTVMPLAGAGFFAAQIGIAAAIAALVLHLIYGAVLGAVYGALVGKGKSGAEPQSSL